MSPCLVCIVQENTLQEWMKQLSCFAQAIGLLNLIEVITWGGTGAASSMTIEVDFVLSPYHRLSSLKFCFETVWRRIILCLMNLRQYCLSNAFTMDNSITRGKVIQVPHLLVVQVDTVSCNLAIIGSDKSVNDLEIRVFERFWR